ncbi:hypothetical protein [[Eubacterium] cellulosolvens]
MRSMLVCIIILAMIASTIIPQAYAATELAYDDGTQEFEDGRPIGTVYAVKFSLPSGWSGAKILTARYYVKDDIATFNVYILDNDGNSIIFGPLAVTPPSQDVFFDVDLSSYDIIVSGDFWVAWEWAVDYNPTIGLDIDDPDGRSYYGTIGSWSQFQTQDIMIRAVVEESTLAVAGVLIPVNKLAIITPYIALAGLVAAISTVYFIKKKELFVKNLE